MAEKHTLHRRRTAEHGLRTLYVFACARAFVCVCVCVFCETKHRWEGGKASLFHVSLERRRSCCYRGNRNIRRDDDASTRARARARMRMTTMTTTRGKRIFSGCSPRLVMKGGYKSIRKTGVYNVDFVALFYFCLLSFFGPSFPPFPPQLSSLVWTKSPSSEDVCVVYIMPYFFPSFGTMFCLC